MKDGGSYESKNSIINGYLFHSTGWLFTHGLRKFQCCLTGNNITFKNVQLEDDGVFSRGAQ